MDFQCFVDQVHMSCCILSVEKRPGGGWGDIRIVCANALYKTVMGPAYYDGMLYQELVPKDIKFEDFCYRAAVLHQRMHAYVETKALGCWTDQTLIPLSTPEGDLGYCQYIFEFTQGAEPDRMAAVSVEAAEAVVRACVTLARPEAFLDNVGAVLDDIMAFSQAYACRVLLLDHRHARAETFCQRVRPGGLMAGLDEDVELPYRMVLSWKDLIGVSNVFIVKSEQDMQDLARRDPDWAASLRAFRIYSLILLPLRQGRTVIGYLYVVNFDPEKLVQIKEMLELMSFILGSELSNHLLIDRLEEMSRTDALTGLNNRTAMVQKLETLKDRAYGVVNVDLNGLKTVNDAEGHEAGDRMLMHAAELITKVFYREDVYRTGGDEFVIVVDGITQEIFMEKVERLRQSGLKSGASLFALGATWSDGSADAPAVFREADERMYADKKAYYQQHPELRKPRG